MRTEVLSSRIVTLSKEIWKTPRSYFSPAFFINIFNHLQAGNALAPLLLLSKPVARYQISQGDNAMKTKTNVRAGSAIWGT